MIYLNRFAFFEFGTFGKIVFPDKVLFTVEREWKDNIPNESCIPNGEYECRLQYFNRGGYQTIEVCNVPNRSNILFHIANFPSELNGCIGLGEEIGTIFTVKGPKLGVKNSRKAFEYFYHTLGFSTPFTLSIRNSEEDFPENYWDLP